MPSYRLRRVLAIFALGLGLAGPVAAGEVTVFAAASTTNIMDEVGALFSARGLGTVKPSHAASSTLAKQIEQGAPAQVFLSADLKWMDYLAERGLINPKSRRNLLGNSLVLIAPAEAATPPVTIGKDFPLAALVGDGRLATGDPDHVPVGLYAKQALENLGVWAAVGPKLARTDSPRSALALVERGEAPFGIVYATDAAISGKVRVVGAFPAAGHDPIVYPVALVAGKETPTARAFLDFLKGPEAKAVFVKHGFTVE